MDESQAPPVHEAQTPTERADASKAERRTALECPECYSHRAEVVHTVKGNKAMCLDCDHVYPIRFRHIETDEPDDDPKQPKKKRSMDEIRDAIVPAPPLDPHNIGMTTALLDEAIASGPVGIRKAQRTALNYARKFQVEIEQHWRRPTKWLIAKQSEQSEFRGRAGARFAMVWRPKFLAALSLTRSVILSARAAHVNQDTCQVHRKADEEFAAQWAEAEADAIELLHSRAFQRALEGDCEPVWYMGIRVGYVRKYDSKLQIEMLRAYKPDTFKTAGVNVNVGIRNTTLVLTEDQRHRLMDYNRQWLEDPSTLEAETPALQNGTPQPQRLSP